MTPANSYGPGKVSLRTLAIVGAALALAMPAAAANLYDWSYSDGTDTASGTITATFVTGDTYLVTMLTGTWDGVGITLDSPGTCCFVPSNDNLLFPNNDGGNLTSGLLDNDGIAFSTGSDDINLFYSPGYDWLDPSLNGGSGTFTLTLIATPEPATWALMLAGFAGLGAALRTRRKLAIA